ncbi:MAG: hypothetical protein ACTHJN_18450 [Ginsengibacter sp.]
MYANWYNSWLKISKTVVGGDTNISKKMVVGGDANNSKKKLPTVEGLATW